MMSIGQEEGTTLDSTTISRTGITIASIHGITIDPVSVFGSIMTGHYVLILVPTHGITVHMAIITLTDLTIPRGGIIRGIRSSLLILSPPSRLKTPIPIGARDTDEAE